MWFMGLVAIIAIYFLYNFVSSQNNPTAADIASGGTLAPGSTVDAGTAGGVGYGVPGQDMSAAVYSDPNAALNYSLMSALLNSGANSTAPSSIGPAASVTNSSALGTVVDNTASSIGSSTAATLNPSSTAASAITMPSLDSLLPPAIPTGADGGTLTAPSAPAASVSPAAVAASTPASPAADPGSKSAPYAAQPSPAAAPVSQAQTQNMVNSIQVAI